MNLYELDDQWWELQETLAADQEEDLTSEQREMLDLNEGNWLEKVERYCKVILNMDAEVLALKLEEQKLRTRRQVRERQVKRLKEALKESMLMRDRRTVRLHSGVFRPRIIPNSRPSIQTLVPANVPARFWVSQDPKLDKDRALKWVMKERGGEEIEPGETISQGPFEVTRGTHLRL